MTFGDFLDRLARDLMIGLFIWGLLVTLSVAMFVLVLRGLPWRRLVRGPRWRGRIGGPGCGSAHERGQGAVRPIRSPGEAETTLVMAVYSAGSGDLAAARE